MALKEEILNFLSENKDDFFSRFNLTRIGLFGSIANGSDTESSDIDLLVEFRPNTERLFHKKWEIRSILSEKFNRKVDIATDKYLKSYVREYIINFTIYV